MVMSTKEMRTTVADLGDARRSDQTQPPSGTSRNAGIDAQRASLTLLVVFHHAAIMIGGAVFYCAGSLDTIAKLAAEGIPVVGHVGLIPARATWTGGFKAVGKTAVEAMQVSDHVKQLEAAGAVAAEIEVVPARVASEISKRPTLFLMSMGAGSGCDARYLFAEDVLGYSRGHQPRHAKIYRNFHGESERLQRERIAAFQEFRADVEKGAFPEHKHLVPIADAEFETFVKGLEKR
jgi:3-methyl-2-oxobutanoate hydroxymethyltransferase